MPTSPIVEMKDISISFPGVKALDRVNFRLFPGEVHALMGENGAGKSTLIKALTGVYTIDEGTVIVSGRSRRLGGTADAQAAGISTVYQEVNLCTNLSIGENVMLGYEVRGPFGINWAATHRRASQMLQKVGLGALNPRLPLSSLSIALQQLVAISRATVTDSKVLILDEPTSSLDANEVEDLFRVIRALRDEGVAILFVSHFLDQIYEISDRLTVLRNGVFQGEFMTTEIEQSELISTMVGKEVGALDSLERASARRDVDRGTPVYEARGISRKGSLEPTDATFHAGEVLGIAGLLGSGRTELARLVYGADKLESGTVRLRGAEANISSPSQALEARIAYASENRRDEGIIRDLSVRENLILAVQAERGWARPLPAQEKTALVEKYMTALNVRPADPDRPIRNLSGGNQQKVLLGRWLATQPEVLILDEPTRGIDVGAKTEIMEQVIALAEDGVAIVFISSELDEVVRLSDRIMVMKDRRKLAELVVDETVTSDSIITTIADESAPEQPGSTQTAGTGAGS
ncbi:MAG TPA: sugar ABC transporter ATP-binding protein [Candidatus Brachybacterium merdavium]|uniref:Sugar ABC transporter ATP-binding protein n=1 Tax=Candidatus Brachybacterium merdavium TaxID=2838513 RepID=A0A9D2LF53_9MICO|nr:sugar ABC transporter ATP-binding protein [Candidatus Brachybacterium merdavium]